MTDLPYVINVLIKLFADDSIFYSVVSSNADNRVQFILDRAVDWASVWKMIFNIIKCRHLHIGKHFTGIKYTMESHGQQSELEKVKNEKDLGVIIDQNLTFRDHITSKVNIAYRNLGSSSGPLHILAKKCSLISIN